jgi:ABC-type multidrug transport system ATPase subunit
MEEAAEADYVIVIDNGEIAAKGNARRAERQIRKRQAYIDMQKH